MRIPKALAVSLILIVVMVAAALVPVRMYHDDIKALKRFVASYEDFDKLMPGSPPDSGRDALDRVGEVVAELRVRSNLRLSSLIKNDAELMAQAVEIAELARREHQSASDGFSEESGRWHEKRMAAYARFKELAGTNGRHNE